MFFIYVYENKITGKIYIGKTNDLIKRNREHISGHDIPKGSLIDKKIKRYGRENFDLWIISVSYNVEQAFREEKYWIAEMRSQLGRHMVYNKTDGGEGISGIKRSDEWKRKQSESQTGKSRGKGRKHSQETKLKQSVNMLGKNKGNKRPDVSERNKILKTKSYK